VINLPATYTLVVNQLGSSSDFAAALTLRLSRLECCYVDCMLSSNSSAINNRLILFTSTAKQEAPQVVTHIPLSLGKILLTLKTICDCTKRHKH
jgi:hypothetical protein